MLNKYKIWQLLCLMSITGSNKIDKKVNLLQNVQWYKCVMSIKFYDTAFF